MPGNEIQENVIYGNKLNSASEEEEGKEPCLKIQIQSIRDVCREQAEQIEALTQLLVSYSGKSPLFKSLMRPCSARSERIQACNDSIVNQIDAINRFAEKRKENESVLRAADSDLKDLKLIEETHDVVSKNSNQVVNIQSLFFESVNSGGTPPTARQVFMIIKTLFMQADVSCTGLLNRSSVVQTVIDFYKANPNNPNPNPNNPNPNPNPAPMPPSLVISLTLGPISKVAKLSRSRKKVQDEVDLYLLSRCEELGQGMELIDFSNMLTRSPNPKPNPRSRDGTH